MIKRVIVTSAVIAAILLILITRSNRATTAADEFDNLYGMSGRLLKGAPPEECYTGINPAYLRTDVNSLIKLHDARDVEKKRTLLIQSIWKSNGFPTEKLPETVTVSVPSPLPELTHLARVDEFKISIGNRGFLSVAYMFHPEPNRNRLMIFHQGHANDLRAHGGRETIQFLLSKGYTVVALYMPLYGPNVKHPFQNHDQLGLLESPDFCPLQIFLEPVVASLNYVTRNFRFKETSMIGISGGGWTTTLYAAIDPRIQYSYPVAGTLPLYLTSWPCAERRCWEDARAHIYSIVDYTELYILGAHGSGRKQVQVLNQFDSCCYYGIGYQTYENVVSNRLSMIGPGNFQVVSDKSFVNEHKISNYALRAMFDPAFLKRKKGRYKETASPLS